MEQTISDWSLLEADWTANQFDSYQYPPLPYTQYGETPPGPLPEQPPPEMQHHIPSPPQAVPLLLTTDFSAPAVLRHDLVPFPRGDNPREIRNKAEKQRRDKLNQSIAELAAMVPPVVAASRKIDKTGVLRLTAHYLRAHQYVFGDTIGTSEQDFSSSSAQAVLGFLHGFLLTTTYKGLIVVVSQNVTKYLGYSELDLLGQSIFNITHEEDRQLLKEHLMPQSHLLGPNGELLVPDEPDGAHKVSEALARDKRRFVIRFKKLAKRSEPVQYLSCHVEGCLRKSDKACRGYTRCCQMVRRARARGDNPCSSGNDVVFVGIVRPTTETFQTESNMEEYHMEYRTRHSVDGEIIECEQRIALVTGYMTHEVHGVNAMNFMHRDDVRWVIIALREMYDSHRLVGESCYRLMTKSGHFIYMRTRGQLDVDENTRAVTSFACTNTVVEEREGKELIKLMKKKFTMLVNNNDDLPDNADTDDSDDEKDCDDGKAPPVEDPRQLEKVILHLVTNLPSPKADDDPRSVTPDRGESPSRRLSIIPPKKERIVTAIDNIYKVLKNMDPKTEKESKKNPIENSNEPSTSQAEYCELLPSNMLPSTSGINLRRGINFPSSTSQTGLYALHSPLSATIVQAESHVAQLPASSFNGTQDAPLSSSIVQAEHNAAPQGSTSSHKSMYLAVPTSAIVQADRHAARLPPASFRATQDALLSSTIVQAENLAVPQPSTSSQKPVYITVPKSAKGQADRQGTLQSLAVSFRATQDALMSSAILQAERRTVSLPSASHKAICHNVPTSTTVAEQLAPLPTSSYSLEHPTVLLAATGETAAGSKTNQQELVATRTQLAIQHPDYNETPNQGSSILTGYNRSPPSTSSMGNTSKSTQSDNVPPHVIKYHLLLAPCYNIRYLPLPSTSQQVDRAQPGPSSSEISRLKRGNDCQQQVVGTKKKICEPVERTEQSDRLERFLDEAMLNTNIENAVRALEQNQGPVFPELISLEDVEEILANIEAAQDSD